MRLFSIMLIKTSDKAAIFTDAVSKEAPIVKCKAVFPAAGRNGTPVLSWCADQSGLIVNGTAPGFSLCSDGMSWFQSREKWQGNACQPSDGTIIFFDWNGDGNPEHVGIVEKCEAGRVYTVEGNSGDAVRQRNYEVGATVILGYGLVFL